MEKNKQLLSQILKIESQLNKTGHQKHFLRLRKDQTRTRKQKLFPHLDLKYLMNTTKK